MKLLIGTCAVLFVMVQAVTVAQGEPKTSSAAVSASGETLRVKKAAASDSKSSFMLKKGDPAPKNATKKVDIDVYYETRCPGCLLFLNKTLEPLWNVKANRELFNINMYTYGNGMTVPVVNISDGYKFWHPESTGDGWKNVQICQHGSDECMGNLVQVCAKSLGDPEKHLDLIFCMAGTTIQGYGVEKSTFECMDKVGLDKDKVRECVTSPKGDQLISDTGAETHKLKGRLGTPWVMINGQHAEDKILMNSTLLLGAVCKQSDNAPGVCAPFAAAKDDAPKDQDKKDDAPSDSDPDFTVLGRNLQEESDLLKVSKDQV